MTFPSDAVKRKGGGMAALDKAGLSRRTSLVLASSGPEGPLLTISKPSVSAPRMSVSAMH